MLRILECIKLYFLHPGMLQADMQAGVGILLRGAIAPAITGATLFNVLPMPSLHPKLCYAAMRVIGGTMQAAFMIVAMPPKQEVC
ncbi:hypothetical protein AA11825_1248 [Acetobacter pomorum DSM 11825]|nr:hypothetical protein AA11825_1248 [Acetobacter pomorum DSM 11825]